VISDTGKWYNFQIGASQGVERLRS